MRRILPLLCLLLILPLVLCTVTPAADAAALQASKIPSPTCGAKAMVLLDADSGTLLAAQNADARLPMASTTKIMTALVVLERLPLERVVTVPPEATGIEGSSVYLFAGEQITVKTLLYALLLSSANDAAVALAIEAAGTVADFAVLMNEKAAKLGLTDTHFCNPHGLHNEAHYTTAKELALLTAHALENEHFARIVSTQRYTAGQNGTDATRLFLNHNRLLKSYKGALGVKTGYTKVAGRCLVSAAEREGLRLVCVTLSCPNDWKEHTALLNWGFSAYERYTPASPALSLPVVGGKRPTAEILPKETPSLLLPKGSRVERITELPRFLFGGFEAGKEVGTLIYRLDGAEIARIPLVTATACERERPPSIWARIKHFFQK